MAEPSRLGAEAEPRHQIGGEGFAALYPSYEGRESCRKRFDFVVVVVVEYPHDNDNDNEVGRVGRMGSATGTLVPRLRDCENIRQIEKEEFTTESTELTEDWYELISLLFFLCALCVLCGSN